MELPQVAIRYDSLCQLEVLLAAWEKVSAKDTTGGVDQERIKDFEAGMPQKLADLQLELVERRYVPEPYLTIFIPKGDGERRQLGMLTVRDKVVQQAVLSMLAPPLERDFLPCSYGYRPGKGPVKAVRQVWHLIRHEQHQWFIKLDFDNFFDNIPHVPLLEKLSAYVEDSELLGLVRLCLQMGYVERDLDWTDRTKGVPQGALLSPLLSNLYLHGMDAFIVGQGVGYVRYADDFVLFAKNEKEAQQVGETVEAYIREQFQLALNEGAVVSHLGKGLPFLGLHFYDSHYGLSEEKLKGLKEKLKTAIDLEKGHLSATYSQAVRGIKQYYGNLLPEDVFMPLDSLQRHQLGLELAKHKRHFRTQKSIRLALEPLEFFTSVFQSAKKEIVKALSGSKRKGPLPRTEVTVGGAAAIQQKKAKYERLQSAAMELTIQQHGVLLGMSARGITVKQKGKNILQAPTAHVKYISVFSQGVLISSGLIHHCSKHDIPIDFFKGNGELYARFHDPSNPDEQLWQAQLRAQSDGTGLRLAKAWAANKVNNQVKLLKYFHKYQKKDTGFTALFSKNTGQMEAIRDSIGQVEGPGLVEARQQLMGKEGSAGALYWEVVKKLLPEELGFVGRTGKGATDPVNVLLNYGYGILYSRMWDALLRARLSPYISYLHTAKRGEPTLSFDLIEEFRQGVVDRTVFALLNRQFRPVLKQGQLDEQSRRQLVDAVLGRLNAFELFRGERRRLSDIIRHQALALAEHLGQPKFTYKPYSYKW